MALFALCCLVCQELSKMTVSQLAGAVVMVILFSSLTSAVKVSEADNPQGYQLEHDP